MNTYVAAGNYPLTVTVWETVNGNTVATTTATGVAHVADPNLGVTAATVNAFAGTAVAPQQLASISDGANTAPAANYTATINWGDGTTTAGDVVQSGGPGTTYLVMNNTASHTFAQAGTYTVTITVTETVNGAVVGTAAATGTGTVAQAVTLPDGSVWFYSGNTINAAGDKQISHLGAVPARRDPRWPQPGCHYPGARFGCQRRQHRRCTLLHALRRRLKQRHQRRRYSIVNALQASLGADPLGILIGLELNSLQSQGIDIGQALEAGSGDLNSGGQIFENGGLYWSTATGVHAILGQTGGDSFLGKFASMATEAINLVFYTPLGWPTSDVQTINGFTYQQFQNGALIQSYWGDMHPGAILGTASDPTTIWGKYLQSGFALGQPLGDAAPGAYGFPGTWQTFQNGVIYSSSTTGTYAITGNVFDGSTFAGKYNPGSA